MKRLLFFLLAACVLLSGCDEETGESEIYIPDITPKNGYHYALAEDCGEGCIYKSGTVMWYYDYKHKTSVPFCADPACTHEDETCAAYLPGRVFGYKDKFVIAGNEWNHDAENFIDKDIFVLEEFDIASQTKREVMRLNRRRCCNTYTYGNKLFIGLTEEYFLDGEYLFATPDHNRVYLMVVSPDTLEVEFMSDTIMDGSAVNMDFYGVDNGQLFFALKYIERDDPDSEAEHFVKPMVYDIEKKEVSEPASRVAVTYLNGCAVYFDGKTVTFDCGDKVCELTSDYELPYVPFIPLLFENGKVYTNMTIETGEYVLLIYDTETEKMSMVKHVGLGDLRFVKELENEYIFTTYGSSVEPPKITALSKEECVISEVSPERYNELCKDHYEAYQN